MAPAEDLPGRLPSILARLQAAHDAREAALAACRLVIRNSSRAIRSVHRREMDSAAELTAAAEAALRDAQRLVEPHPAVAYAGFLHDAAKEYVEAVCTMSLVRGQPLPDADGLGVELPAWLNGLAEAASELRRHLLDRLRADQTAVAEDLLSTMEDVYDALVGVDFPDAVTAGLRRTADALRAVLERTRSDVTTTIMQLRLRRALERAAGEDEGPARPR